MTIAALTVRHDLDISTEIISIKIEVKIKELADVFVDFLQFCIQIAWNLGGFFSPRAPSTAQIFAYAKSAG